MSEKGTEVELMNSDDLASFMKRTREHVMYRVACLPDFPKAIRIGGGNPLWVKSEVVAWTLKQREKRAA